MRKLNLTDEQREAIFSQIYDNQTQISRLAELKMSIRIFNEEDSINKDKLKLLSELVEQQLNFVLKTSLADNSAKQKQEQKQLYGDVIQKLNDSFSTFVKSQKSPIYLLMTTETQYPLENGEIQIQPAGYYPLQQWIYQQDNNNRFFLSDSSYNILQYNDSKQSFYYCRNCTNWYPIPDSELKSLPEKPIYCNRSHYPDYKPILLMFIPKLTKKQKPKPFYTKEEALKMYPQKVEPKPEPRPEPEHCSEQDNGCHYNHDKCNHAGECDCNCEYCNPKSN